MKKRLVNLISAIVAIFCGLFAFSACSKVEFKVNFVVDGAVYATLNTNGEEIIKMPENPTKDDYDFDGWYWDKDTWQTPFTANSLLDAPLSSDMSVYCKWKPKTVHVSDISLNKSEVSLHVDETEILTATITPANATDTSVLWESSNTTIATVTGGKITALRVGSATITATANDGGQIASCRVTVYSISAESVSLNYTKISMLYGESKTLTASVTPQNATETGVIWQSSNASVVAVENGKLTAMGYGSAVITVTTVDGGKTATCAVEVIDDTITFKTLQVAADGETVYGKVSNATETFSFLKEIEEHGNATYQVYEDRGCKTKIVSKTIDLYPGDNTVYVLQTVGEKIKLYTVTVRRRPIYNVSFDSNGGTAVQSQQVEEDSFAIEPTTRRTGYTFTRWNYDFSQAITQDTEIKAVWSANTDTKYRVEYYWENVENDEYTLHETNDLQGTTDTATTAERKTYAHFTFDANTSTMQGNINGDGSLVLKAYYTRNIYFVSNSNTDCGSITNAGSRKYGESVSAKATPKNFAYEFLGWFSGETLLCKEFEYAFTAEQDVTAKFQLKEGMSQFSFNATADTCEITGGLDRAVQSLVIPDCVTSIGSQAFYAFRSLESVTIGTGLTSVASDAFVYCSSLKNINVKDLAAWCRMRSLYGILKCDGAVDNEKYLFLNGERVKDLVISDDIKLVSYSAFYKFVFDSVTIQDSQTVVKSEAFCQCSITQATLPGNLVACLKESKSTLQKLTVTGEGGIYGEFAFSSCKNLQSVVISQGLTYIGDSVFAGCSGLTSVTLPNGLNLGPSAFKGCSSLASITLPDDMLFISDSAFEDCGNLTSITIPDSVTSINKSAFKNCANLTSITLQGNCSIGESAFYNCSSLTSITIPNIKYIRNYTFYGCSRLISITIPYGVTSIGKEAFSGCSGLTDITIPNSVTSIGDMAFYNCSNLTSVTIPNGVTDISRSMFSGCSRLTNVTIPDSVTVFRDYAFSRCSSLTGLKIPDSVISFGDYAFKNCTSLERIALPNKLTYIQANWFYDCKNLISIEIPHSVTSIYSSFENFTSLKVYYKGTVDEWLKIQGYLNLGDATHYYYSETKPTGSGNFWHYNESGEIVEWE